MRIKMVSKNTMFYGTRRLKAGDAFVVSARDARILAALGRAEYPEAAKPADSLDDLRAAYRRQFGKKPFHGWSADQLKDKMAAES